jgi:hypothetical protein
MKSIFHQNKPKIRSPFCNLKKTNTMAGAAYFIVLCVLSLALNGFLSPLAERFALATQQAYLSEHSRPESLIFEETFESTRPFAGAHKLQVGPRSHALQYVSKPVYRGTKAARFELRSSDPMVSRGTRAEAYILKNSATDKIRWYSFAAYFPAEGYAYDSQNEAINQWHQSGTPATSLRIKEDRFYLQTGNDPRHRKKIDLGPVTKDSWHEFVFRFVHSAGEDGLIEVWHNGCKLLTHRGGNMYELYQFPQLKLGAQYPNWKIGIYKAGWNKGTTDTDRRVVFYDNIRVGNENATFAVMSSLSPQPAIGNASAAPVDTPLAPGSRKD